MKKLLVIMAMFATTVTATAQQVRKFYWKDSGYWVKVDLNKKTFLADGCGTESEKIQNYKKSGNKESFTTYDGGFTTHHVFTKKSETDYTYTHWRTPSETIEKASDEVTTIEPNDCPATGKATDKATSKATSKVGDKMSGVKGLLNKGKSLFKKDKGKADSGKSDSGKTTKENKSQPKDDIMYAPEK